MSFPHSSPISPLAELLGAAAAQACAEEVEIRPKPGLVDPEDPGSHSDMDRWTFHLSGAALAPFWSGQARIGLEGIASEEALPLLRRRGLEMERAMFEATGGVNTHKGLIFALSLLLYGAGRILRSRRPDRANPGGKREDEGIPREGLSPPPPAPALASLSRRIREEAALAVRQALRKEMRELRDAPPPHPTHGQRLALRYGITGVRGEAEAGFPSLGEAQRIFRRVRGRGATRNDAALAALLRLMGTCEDSNVIHRAGLDFFLGRYRRAVREAERAYDPVHPGNHAPLRALDRLLRSVNASPGGAADGLACVLFLDRCEGLVIMTEIVYLT